MAKKGTLGSIGILLSVIAGLILLIFGILLIIGFLLTDVRDQVQSLQFDYLTLGENALLVYGLVSVILGGITVWAWQNKKIERSMFFWGVIFIIFGLLTGALPSLLLIVGGVLLVLDVFL